MVYNRDMTNSLMVKRTTLGDYGTNCYVVHRRDGSTCWIVDAGFEPTQLTNYIARKNLTVEKIVLTHAHFDHIGGLALLHERWPEAPILIHEDEAGHLTDPLLNLSAMTGAPVVAPQATDLLEHGQTLELDGLTFHIRHTPGHSPGGVCLHQPEHQTAIVGDTLFAGSIGRHDFPMSDGRLLIKSIQEQLLTLPDETIVRPGHGPQTTIGQERATNPFLNGSV